MSRTVRTPTARGDRLLLTLFGVLLLAGGALLIDAGTSDRLGVLTVPAEISKKSAASTLDASWWSWALVVAGGVVGVLALVWLLRPRRRSGSRLLRLPASTGRGRVELDLASLATAVADQVAATAPVEDASAVVRQHGGRHLVEVRARLLADAEVEALAPAVEAVRQDVLTAFGERTIAVRVVVDAPRPPSRRARSRAQDSVRVRPETLSA